MIDAVRVPPSATSTSQSQVIDRPGILSRSTAARRLRAISRWISVAREPGPRRCRSGVEPGIIAYSAVTQPCVGRPLASRLIHFGVSSATLAVQMTRVLPATATTAPAAIVGTSSSENGRS